MTTRLQSLGAVGQEITPLSLLASRIKNVPLRLLTSSTSSAVPMTEGSSPGHGAGTSFRRGV